MFSKQSFREQIGTCQAWSMKLNDNRRRKKPLFLNKDGFATALNFSASMLRNGARVPADRVTLPKVAPATELPEPGADAAELDAMAADFLERFEEVGSGEININSREAFGWACSYRSAAPEKQLCSTWRKRWSKARKAWASTPLQAPRHRRPQAEQLVIQKGWAKRRRMVRDPVA